MRVRGGDPQFVLAATVACAAAGHQAVVLIDAPSARAANQRFCDAYAPARFVTLTTPGDLAALEPKSRGEVVCGSSDPRLRLAAAALAVAAQARVRFDGEIRHEVQLLSAGTSPPRRLTDEAAILELAADLQSERGPIDTLVLVNPHDSGLSHLAPLAMTGRRAALLLTNAAGTNAGELLRAAAERRGFAHVEHVMILGSPEAIPPERRPNPHAGKDSEIDMEPGTPAGDEPHTWSIGRLFHRDPAMVALTLAQSRLLPPDGAPRTALVASNPGESLPMLEAFSRTSARELESCGYATTALFGDNLNGDELRRRLPDADVILWEGHHNTLIRDWGFSSWTEPLRPALFILQSCLALTEDKATPLFDRGALAVIGSSSRIYSATGGAFSLACLDAILHERETLGGSVRSAKNFLTAYGRLKQQRLSEVRFGGANQRSAWAFTLWGDPTLRLPAPALADGPSQRVRCDVHRDTIIVRAPAARQSLRSESFVAPFRPNGRLAGLVRSDERGDKRLASLAFAEVPLPQAPPHGRPIIHTRFAESNWVFLWDSRRRAGWLLAVLPPEAERDIRFRIEWTSHDG